MRVIILAALACLIGSSAFAADYSWFGGYSWTQKTQQYGKQFGMYDIDARRVFRFNLRKGRRDRNTDVYYANQYTAPWQTRDVKKNWGHGWKGQNVDVAIIDNFSYRYLNGRTHGDMVQTVLHGGVSNNRYVSGVAPASRLTQFERPGDMLYGRDFDVINYSWDYRHHNADSIRAAEHVAYRSATTGAISVIAAGNSGLNCQNAYSCSNLGVAHTGNMVNGEYVRDPYNLAIVAGAEDYASSNRAGILKKDFVVTSGRGPVVGWQETNGTSFAAPRVAGTAALIMSKFPRMNKMGVKKLILETADGMGSCAGLSKRWSCSDETYGHGRLNVGAALSPFGKLR